MEHSQIYHQFNRVFCLCIALGDLVLLTIGFSSVYLVSSLVFAGSLLAFRKLGPIPVTVPVEI